ncbi:hypothetical protein BKA82DRAFT_3973454, partial [Pisolithus tinctorius]
RLWVDKLQQWDANLADKIYMFSSWFYTMIRDGEQVNLPHSMSHLTHSCRFEESYNKVMKWKSLIYPFSKRYVVMPIHERYVVLVDWSGH